MSHSSKISGDVKIASGAIVCTEQTVIRGSVQIGIKTIVHPTAQIIAEVGPIIIGDYNLIEERVKIINRSPEPMTIGNYNVFEVDAHSESQKIGDLNILESKCYVGPKTHLVNGCIIGATCKVLSEEILPDNTVIFGCGTDLRRRIQHEKPSAQNFQIDFLSKVMPNYQKLEKPNWQPDHVAATLSPTAMQQSMTASTQSTPDTTTPS